MNTKLTMTALLVSSTLVLAALAAIPALNSIVFASTLEDNHDGGKHMENNGQDKKYGDPDQDGQKNHGCPKGEQGYDSSGHNCYHPG